MFRAFCTIFYSLFLLSVLAYPAHAAEEDKPKDPPENEALIPFVDQREAWRRINPPFPFYPTDERPMLAPTAITQQAYEEYWARWQPLWPHLNYFHELLEKAAKQEDEGETLDESVQVLSAKTASFLLYLKQAFPEDLPESFRQLESYRRLSSVQQHLQDLLFLLKSRGSPYAYYRGSEADLAEEAVAYHRLFISLREDLEAIKSYKEMHQLFERGFMATDK